MSRARGILWVVWCAVMAVAPQARGQMAFAWGVEMRAGAKAAAGPQVALVKELGAGWVRVEVGGSESAEGVRWVRELLKVAGEKDVKVLPVIVPPVDVRGERDGKVVREKCRDEGRRWAAELAGKVEYYEVGGRLDEACLIAGRSGEAAGDYDPAAYERCREVVRGLAEGIREKDAKAKRVINGGGSRVGFVQRLADDGVGFEQVSWRWEAGFERADVGEKLLRLGKGPVWVVEVPVGGGGETAEQERARAEALRRIAEGLYLLPEVRAVFVASLLTEPEGGGLVGMDGVKRPAFDAYRRVIERTREKRY